MTLLFLLLFFKCKILIKGIHIKYFNNYNILRIFFKQCKKQKNIERGVTRIYRIRGCPLSRKIRKTIQNNCVTCKYIIV